MKTLKISYQPSVQKSLVNGWSEATKNHPCPLCQKPDWCSIHSSGDAVLCRRTDVGSQPTEWRHVKNSKDGYPIFSCSSESNHHGGGTKRLVKPARKRFKPTAIPSEVGLAWLLEQPTPPQTIQKGNKVEIVYSYSLNQWGERVEIYDQHGERTEKAIYPYHLNQDGQAVKGKGDHPWQPYRLNEVEEHGSGKWVIGVEGEKCVESVRFLGLVAFTFQGGSWTQADIESAMLRFKKAGVEGVIYIPDNDEAGKKKAQSLAQAAAKIGVPLIILPIDKLMEDPPEGADIADLVEQCRQQGMSESDLIKKLEQEIHAAADQRREQAQQAIDSAIADDSDSDNDNDQPQKPPKPDQLGRVIAEEYRDQWLYCDELSSWMAYEVESVGVWTTASEDYIAAQIDLILESNGISGYGTNAYVNNIIGKLKRKLYCRQWGENTRDYLPFSNGVLSLEDNKLHPHSPGFRLTWKLPRNYNLLETSWSHIDSWLTEATQGDTKAKEILIHFAAAVLRGRNDLQKFAYLLGSGGTGKSTFTDLLTALVGARNTVFADISQLDDKHEVINLFGKRLLVSADQDSLGKKTSNFKKLTGGDHLSGRKLFKDSMSFKFSGLAVVTSNPPSIFPSSTANWLMRRMLLVEFNHSVPRGKTRNLTEEFAPQLGAFTNHLLNIPDSELERVLKQIDQPELSASTWENQCRADGLAAWIDEWLIPDPEAFSLVGSNAREWTTQGDYNPERSSLYGSYTLFCRDNGRTPKNSQNFSSDLLEAAKRVLGWDVAKERKRFAGKPVRGIQGVRLRTSKDSDILPATEALQQLEVESKQSVTTSSDRDNPVTTPVTTPKPPPNQDCDNRDNPNQNFEEIEFSQQQVEKSDCGNVQNIKDSAAEVVTVVTTPEKRESEAVTEPVTEAVTEVVTEVVTEAVTQSESSKVEPKEGTQSFEIGDRVRWNSCPGHIEELQPFVIGEIQGDSAQLDFVHSPAPLSELRLWVE